jgi:hypothetical protein
MKKIFLFSASFIVGQMNLFSQRLKSLIYKGILKNINYLIKQNKRTLISVI